MIPGVAVNWEKVREVFQQAVDLPESERFAYLDAACAGDSELRAQVDRLLADHDESGGLLDRLVEQDHAPAEGQLAGRTLARYRILEKLGEGGMGVVHKAEDTKLGRTAALKFLLPHLVTDEATRRRFLREAQAAAALSHSNICTVYEIDDVADQMFIAMEFVDGPSVAGKIRPQDGPTRPLPLDEALDIAIQTAGGLYAAHEKGVVHRDIKSANLLVTRAGQVKITDFGLALLAERTRLTKSGTTMGTPAYMSPEQVQGKSTDRRSDIWSLGVVLYEMLTGRLPFDGDYEQAITYSIVNEDPEPVTALRSGLPIELDRILAKLLAKRPEERYQHVDEFLVDVKAVRDKLKRSSANSGELKADFMRWGAAEPARAVPSTPPRSAVVQRSAWIATGVALGLIAVFVVSNPREESQNADAIVFTVDIGAGPPETYAGTPAVSPNGRAIAYVAQDDSGREVLWLRRLDSNSARALEGTQGARRPFWSPDGRFLAFFADGQLKKIDLLGGPPISLCDAGSGLGGTWSAAGEIVFAPSNRTPLHRVSAGGGVSTPITSLDPERGENSHRWPHFLPDGRRFLFTIRAADPGNTVLAAGSIGSPEVKRLFRAHSNVRYAPARNGRAGYLLFVRDHALIAQPFDANSLELRGEPTGVTQGLWHNVVSVSAHFSVSDNGQVLVYSRGSGLHQLWWFDRDGKRLESIGGPGEQIQPRISPDGTKLAVSMPDPYTGNRDVWVMELATGVPQRVTFAPSNDWQASWSADGSRIVFASDRKSGQGGLYQRLVSGGSEDEDLFQDGGSPSDWSLDAKFILFGRAQQAGNPSLWLLPIGPRREPIPFSQKRFAESDAHFSPDSQWIAFTSNESGRAEVYVAPSPEVVTGKRPRPVGPRQISTAGGAGARWRRDGRELYYLAPDHNLMRVEVKTGERFEASVPTVLFKTCEQFFWTGYWQSTYDPAADGQRFLFNCPVESVSPLEVMVNWTAKLEKSGAP